jgi:hypothetical protein
MIIKNVKNSFFVLKFDYTAKRLILYKEEILLGLDQVYYWRYNGKNIIIYLNMDVTLFGTFSHIIKMMRKVDPHAERGAGIFIKESSIKVIDAHWVLVKRDW